ncbi:hypothetical protein TNIN_347801 [Trichonephila inaurata madagascariensis]|uniref:Uncharacterized protein n=1 Tax=Trichonephila inaurata madagascariensis TaxID=2747483 RepID=A0A8X7C293_9ARAC|nr:hypothetical protein TNIN_347801 [Trichonephila inaurata madagascariensis]
MQCIEEKTKWITIPADPFQKWPPDSFKTNDSNNTWPDGTLEGYIINGFCAQHMGVEDWTRDLPNVNHPLLSTPSGENPFVLVVKVTWSLGSAMTCKGEI